MAVPVAASAAASRSSPITAKATLSTSPPTSSASDPLRFSLLRAASSSQTAQSGSTPPQPIDFPYTGSSIRPYLSTSFKTSAERSFSGGPHAARFREPTEREHEEELEDDDMHDHNTHAHPPGPDPDADGVFTFSSPYLGSKALLEPTPSTDSSTIARTNTTAKTSPDPALNAMATASAQHQQHSAAGPGSLKSTVSSDLPQRVMSPGWAAASLGRMTLSSPNVRPVQGASPLPTLSSLGPSSMTAAPGTSPAGSGPGGPHAALAHRRLSNNRAPTMRDVYGSGSPSSGAGLYGVSPASASGPSSLSGKLSSSLPANSAFHILPGTSPSTGAPGLGARRISHTRPARPGLSSNTSTSGSAAVSARQGPYTRPSHGPGSSNRSQSRNRHSLGQLGKDGVDRNTSGLGLLGAAALAESASSSFALRHDGVHGDLDVDGIDYAMEDIEGTYLGGHKPPSSDLEDSDLDDDDDDDAHEDMILSLVNEVDDAEATEDESEEIKEHIRSSGASSYTNLGPSAGLLAHVHTLGSGGGHGAHRGTPLRSIPTAVPGRGRSSRSSIGGSSGLLSGPSSLGLNFREAHGHAPHQPYPSRGIGVSSGVLNHHRSPRLGGVADVEAAFPPTTLSSSPIYSSSVPIAGAGFGTSLQLQRQLSSEKPFNHAGALAAMRHHPYGSSPVGPTAAAAARRSSAVDRKTRSAQAEEDDGSDQESSSAETRARGDVSASSTGGGGGVDENAEVAMIRERLGGAAHCSAFISKLWYLLINPTLYSKYIRWSEAGDSIILSNDVDISAEFANDVLPKLFKHGNNASFIRQLNLYGFQRVPSSRLLDAAEQKAALAIQKERGGRGGTAAVRSSSRTRASDASIAGGVGLSASPSASSSASAGLNGAAAVPMTTALHLYGAHSSFAHPSFRRGQESLLPSMKPRSSKKPKGNKGGGTGDASKEDAYGAADASIED
ncbi:hypothetical protein V8E36_009509 [Tilletia maclaganii]